MLGGFTLQFTSKRNEFNLNAMTGLLGKAREKLEVKGFVSHKWKQEYGASFMGREDKEGPFPGIARFLLIPSDTEPTTNPAHSALPESLCHVDDARAENKKHPPRQLV